MENIPYYMNGANLKRVRFIGSSRKDLKKFPPEVKSVIGQALWNAENGDKHKNAKPLKGFHGAGVLEIVDDFDGDTYRGVYTVKFAEIVYVLHAFKKKSKQGSKTPQNEIDLIQSRLTQACEDYEELQESKKKEFNRWSSIK
jgi:phage-related protein